MKFCAACNNEVVVITTIHGKMVANDYCCMLSTSEFTMLSIPSMINGGCTMWLYHALSIGTLRISP